MRSGAPLRMPLRRPPLPYPTFTPTPRPMILPRSPLAPETSPELPAIGGLRLGAVRAFGRYGERADLMLMLAREGTSVAGVFTRSACASAPVEWCRRHAPAGLVRGVLVNAGNANAFTGAAGREAVERTARAAAEAIGCLPEEVLVASTGVIGEALDPAPIEAAVEALAADAVPDGWAAAAGAILTTDTFPKLAVRRAMVDGVPVTLCGIAKGSGMIAPDMATMLSFLATDAWLPAEVLQECLEEAVRPSFNAITVDGDTSTSDTVLLLATGTARNAAIEGADDPRLIAFREALGALAHDLAMQVVRDGEGATKLIEVRVTGAATDPSARRIARSIANSPLVKTAIAGEDANWGRVVMAVGKAGEPADRDRLSISFGGVRVAANGVRVPDYSEEAASAVVRESRVPIHVDLALGSGEATVWTCDLTHGYISINGDYRS